MFNQVDWRATVLLAVGFVALASSSVGGQTIAEDCGYRPPNEWLSEFRAAVQRGEVVDPALRPRPRFAPRPVGAGGIAGAPDPTPCLTPAHVFAFEDTAGVLLTNFSDGQLLDLMAAGANALIAAHGDVYDFIGFWVNFVPDHQIGAAFYMPIFNDVSGIGDPSTVGTPIFDNRASLGLGGTSIQGYVMMWNINDGLWVAGAGGSAAVTRLVLGQEFEHRWALFLPDLLDGRTLQGNNGSCGRIFHWNFRVDGQGSGMEIREWVGSSPAELTGSSLTFNGDIGGVFSYADLYLMGYVTPAEMDAGQSELRYMDTSDCSQFYNGVISSFGSADVIASAGPRVPDSTTAQQHFRTGWVMIHQPGDLPSAAERAKAIGIHEQHQVDWNFGTLARGTMNNQLFGDADCDGIPDDSCLGDIDISGGVDVVDLLAMLAAWGPCPGCPEDLDGNGFVDVVDLLALLGAWGPC